MDTRQYSNNRSFGTCETCKDMTILTYRDLQGYDIPHCADCQINERNER